MRYACAKREAKVKALFADSQADDMNIRQAANKARRAMNNSWTKRGGTNTKGCYNPAAKSGICVRIEL